MSSVSPQIRERRERVFLVLSGLFLGTLAMLNILGISRFIDLSFFLGDWKVPMVVAVGVLPYPVTFLCTDFISELYGKSRANAVVWMGLVLNVWVMAVLWLGKVLPGFPSPVYDEVTTLAFGAVTASMVAYLTAQFVDVHLFHFWKRLTNGKHLWLRNNGSTLVSQLVDSTAVILITHFYAAALPIDANKPVAQQLLVFIASGYVFKVFFALVDTVPFYIGVKKLRVYLELADDEEVGTV
ncbi:MAG: putative integral membrane protein (TIGR00697 family) [Myxococcota bacterium]|jgi:uncharacterized integral membrane protein (TIGR00697 family)